MRQFHVPFALLIQSNISVLITRPKKPLQLRKTNPETFGGKEIFLPPLQEASGGMHQNVAPAVGPGSLISVPAYFAVNITLNVCVCDKPRAQ